MDNTIKSYNFTILSGWMLGLAENHFEALAFAVIFGFCQHSEDGTFNGSFSYIQQWLQCSRPKAIQIVQSLVEKRLINKEQRVINGVTFNSYSINWEVVKPVYYQSILEERGGKQSLLGSKESLLGSKQSLPNNNSNNYIESIKDNTSSPKVEDVVVSIQDKSFIDTTQTSNNAHARENEPTLFPSEEPEVEKKKKTDKETKSEAREKREAKFREEAEKYKVSNGGEYDDAMVDEFADYWTEPNKSGTQMLWEMKPTFEMKRRLVTWSNKQYNNGRNNRQGGQFGTSTQKGFAQGNGYSGTQQPLTDAERARQSYPGTTEIARSIPDISMF